MAATLGSNNSGRGDPVGRSVIMRVDRELVTMGVQGPRRAQSYIRTANSIIPIATFAGSITLSTYVVVDCPNSRLQAIFAAASELFLTIPLMLFSVYIVLHGKDEDSVIGENRIYRHFIIAQLFVAFILLVTAFLLLSFAICVADAQKASIG